MEAKSLCGLSTKKTFLFAASLTEAARSRRLNCFIQAEEDSTLWIWMLKLIKQMGIITQLRAIIKNWHLIRAGGGVGAGGLCISYVIKVSRLEFCTRHLMILIKSVKLIIKNNSKFISKLVNPGFKIGKMNWMNYLVSYCICVYIYIYIFFFSVRTEKGLENTLLKKIVI